MWNKSQGHEIYAAPRVFFLHQQSGSLSLPRNPPPTKLRLCQTSPGAHHPPEPAPRKQARRRADPNQHRTPDPCGKGTRGGGQDEAAAGSPRVDPARGPTPPTGPAARCSHSEAAVAGGETEAAPAVPHVEREARGGEVRPPQPCCRAGPGPARTWGLKAPSLTCCRPGGVVLRGKGGQDGGREGGTEETGRGGAGAPSPALFSSSSGTSRSRKRLAGKAVDGRRWRAAASLGCGGAPLYGR